MTRFFGAGALALAATIFAAPAQAATIPGLSGDWTALAPGTFGDTGTYDYFGDGGTVKFELRNARLNHIFGTTDTDGDLSPNEVIFDTTVDSVGAVKFFTPVSNPFAFFFQNIEGGLYVTSNQGTVGRLDFEIFQNSANSNLFAFLFDDGSTAPDDNDSNDMVVTADATPVPEPATILLLGAGLLGGASRLRRRKEQQ